MPVSSHYVAGCSTVSGNDSTSSSESSYGRVNNMPISTTTANGTMNRNVNQQASFDCSIFSSENYKILEKTKDQNLD